MVTVQMTVDPLLVRSGMTWSPRRRWCVSGPTPGGRCQRQRHHRGAERSAPPRCGHRMNLLSTCNAPSSFGLRRPFTSNRLREPPNERLAIKFVSALSDRRGICCCGRPVLTHALVASPHLGRPFPSVPPLLPMSSKKVKRNLRTAQAGRGGRRRRVPPPCHWSLARAAHAEVAERMKATVSDRQNVCQPDVGLPPE